MQHSLRDRESLQSATDILLQINNFRTVDHMKVKVKETDIYIRPDIDEFSVIDFDLAGPIIENGQLQPLNISIL